MSRKDKNYKIIPSNSNSEPLKYIQNRYLLKINPISLIMNEKFWNEHILKANLSLFGLKLVCFLKSI